VLQFKDSVELEAEKGSVTLYLVTEPVQPLSVLCRELQKEDTKWRAASLLLSRSPPLNACTGTTTWPRG